MKRTALLIIIFLIGATAFGQNELLVQSTEKGLFLAHTVSAKENFYSIGRLYNIPPKDIASANNLDMANGLSVGQSLTIPLTASNFSQSANNGRPVYYVVGQKEGLYRVSVRNNNVLMANLRKWNKLSNDNISTGQRLVVGYLNSAEANNIVQSNSPVEVTKPTTVENKPEQPVVKQEPKIQTSEPPVVTRKDPEPPATKPVTTATINDGKGGYFKSQFEQQIKQHQGKTDEAASAGIFKTASGWQDAKYYALIDKVEPGTIIKIINPTNNKAIYAKVLGEMSGIRQNQGYDVRISNAGASALEIEDTDKFVVRVNY